MPIITVASVKNLIACIIEYIRKATWVTPQVITIDRLIAHLTCKSQCRLVVFARYKWEGRWIATIPHRFHNRTSCISYRTRQDAFSDPYDIRYEWGLNLLWSTMESIKWAKIITRETARLQTFIFLFWKRLQPLNTRNRRCINVSKILFHPLIVTQFEAVHSLFFFFYSDTFYADIEIRSNRKIYVLRGRNHFLVASKTDNRYAKQYHT